MLLESDDVAEMMEAVGDQATVDGGQNYFYVIFNDVDQIIDYRNEQVTRIDPYCLASNADVANYGIHGEPDGTPITIGGTDYLVMSVNPNGPIFSVLSLEVD